MKRKANKTIWTFLLLLQCRQSYTRLLLSHSCSFFRPLQTPIDSKTTAFSSPFTEMYRDTIMFDATLRRLSTEMDISRYSITCERNLNEALLRLLNRIGFSPCLIWYPYRMATQVRWTFIELDMPTKHSSCWYDGCRLNVLVQNDNGNMKGNRT